MNILQVLPELNVGGVETGTIDLAIWLKAQGHKSVVVSGGGRLVRWLEDAGIKHYQLPIGKKSPLTAIPMIKALREIIRKEEIELIKLLGNFPAIVKDATEQLKPHILATYLYELSSSFSIFYNLCPVLKAEEELKKARLVLIECVKRVLENGLSLLGIDVLNKM